jgi:hypothetical protein
MQTFFRTVVLAILMAAAPLPGFAMRSIGIVSKAEAKEMGIELRATAAGPDAAWLELEFKTEGRLKAYSHVELEIREGDKPLVAYAALAETKSQSGSVVVRLMANRAYLEKITLTVVTGFPSNYAGHELHLKDFIDLEKIK